MTKPKKDLFNIVKTNTLKISTAINAVELAEQRISLIKELTTARAEGNAIDIKDLAFAVIQAKGFLDEALSALIESQLDEQTDR